MTLGERIKQLRIEQGMSQDELAQRLGYKSRSSINKIELGKNDVTQTMIVSIAKVLKTTPAYLMGWNDIPHPQEARTSEFVELFTKLSADQQTLIIAQIKGILAADK